MTSFASELRGEYDKLSIHQASVLRCLVAHTTWSPGCGWHYGTPNRTVLILDSLVKKGLVFRSSHRLVYGLTTQGTQWLVDNTPRDTK